MLTVVKKHLVLLGAYFKLNLSATMEYRSSFLIQVFGMFLNNASFAFFWWLLFDKVGSIGGYGFEDVMLLWAYASSGFGLCFIIFGNARRIIDIILKGELDTYLLQPKDVLLNVIASKKDVSAWGELVYGLTLFIFLKCFNPFVLLLFVVFTITAACLYAAVLITFNALAFFFGNVSSLAGLAFEFLITLSIYPASIFDGVIKLVLFTVIPSGFASLLPVEVVRNFNLWQALAVIAAALVWSAIAYSVFRTGLKKYESGNLMVQKM